MAVLPELQQVSETGRSEVMKKTAVLNFTDEDGVPHSVPISSVSIMNLGEHDIIVVKVPNHFRRVDAWAVHETVRMIAPAHEVLVMNDDMELIVLAPEEAP